jgi:hypothetical protein
MAIFQIRRDIAHGAQSASRCNRFLKTIGIKDTGLATLITGALQLDIRRADGPYCSEMAETIQKHGGLESFISSQWQSENARINQSWGEFIFVLKLFSFDSSPKHPAEAVQNKLF